MMYLIQAWEPRLNREWIKSQCSIPLYEYILTGWNGNQLNISVFVLEFRSKLSFWGRAHQPLGRTNSKFEDCTRSLEKEQFDHNLLLEYFTLGFPYSSTGRAIVADREVDLIAQQSGFRVSLQCETGYLSIPKSSIIVEGVVNTSS